MKMPLDLKGASLLQIMSTESLIQEILYLLLHPQNWPELI
jgi:hypothetical protein